jgi:phosphotransferase system enzyme I (PtsI)
MAVDLGSEAMGLFRTEFLYREVPQLPTEDEQYAHAVAALMNVGGRPITFRTLDLGGDKLPAAVRMPCSANPTMGCARSVTRCTGSTSFRVQLRATAPRSRVRCRVLSR